MQHTGVLREKSGDVDMALPASLRSGAQAEEECEVRKEEAWDHRAITCTG